MSNELALAATEKSHIEEFSAFGNISHFENAQRMAKALCSSSIVPAAYQGDSNLGSCVIALEISNRIGASVLAVMQNLYVVHGKPGWSSQFLISCVNASRKFTPLRYKMTGEKGKDSWGCVAWAQDKTGEILESPEVTIDMAKAEGWYGKNGSKWKTMPELMLRYRTATLFARLYAPELTMGIQTTDEIQDVIEVQATMVKKPDFGEIGMLPSPPADPTPKPRAKRQMHPLTQDAIKQPFQPAVVEQPQATPAPEPAPEPQAAVDDFESIVDGESPEVIALRHATEALTGDSPAVAEKKLVAWCVGRKLIEATIVSPTIKDIPTSKLGKLTEVVKRGGAIKAELDKTVQPELMP